MSKKQPEPRADGAQDEEMGALERRATAVVGRLVDVGIDGVGPLDSATDVADKALAEQDDDVEKAIQQIVDQHVKLATAGGFVTGLGGFLALPVALPANIAGFYVIATRMVAAVAHLRGYDVSQPAARSAVLLALVGTDSTSVLAKAGMNPMGRIAGLATGRLPGPALMVLNKGIGFRLLGQLGRRGLSRLGRGIPLAGGVIGAGSDWWLIRRIAKTARSEFGDRRQLES